jgi:hypothetical protein
MCNCAKKINAFFHVGGRLACWNKFSKFLETQTYDHKEIKLIVVNTVPDIQAYRLWLEKCDYEYAYVETKLRGVHRENRLAEMNANQGAILRKHLNAEYMWLLDDDTIPPPDVISKLLPHFDAPNVMSVSACYRLAPRINNSEHYCCWPYSHSPPYYKKGQGVQVIGGNGWGCALIRCADCGLPCPMEALPGLPGDVSLYRRLHNLGGVAKINWDVECDHLDDWGVNWWPSRPIKIL